MTAPDAQTHATEPSPSRPLWTYDLPASLVTFLVAVPLSMGIALASGAPIMAGLISAAIGGLIVGLLSGVPLQVSGPAAGLAVMVFTYVERFGFRTVLAIAVLGGALQIALGLARVARVTLAISPAVIHGMLAGIGVQIFLSQLHVILGGRPQSSALKNIVELPRQVGDLHGAATVLGLVTIAVLVAWPFAERATKGRLKALPGPLVAVTLGTVIATVMHVELPRVSVPHDWRNAFSSPAWPTVATMGPVLVAAVSLTLVASAESLLSALATDKLHAGARANLDRELVAQGVGNITAGLLGGLPITGVIVRSTANVSSGAKTRLSTMLHGLWVAVFVTQLGFVLNRIPLSVLAGLLCVVGAKLVSPANIRSMVKHGQGAVYFVTIFGVVFVNLLAGIGMGVAVALGQLLYRLTRVEVTLTREPEAWMVRVSGSLTFLGVPKLAGELAKLPVGSTVSVDLDVDLLDHAAWEALENWRGNHERTGGRVEMDELRQIWRPRPGRRGGDEARAA